MISRFKISALAFSLSIVCVFVAMGAIPREVSSVGLDKLTGAEACCYTECHEIQVQCGDIDEPGENCQGFINRASCSGSASNDKRSYFFPREDCSLNAGGSATCYDYQATTYDDNGCN